MIKKLCVIGMVGMALVLSMSSVSTAKVLGPCGAPPSPAPEGKAAAPAMMGPQAPVQKVIRPMERAINFELEAVVGDEIKRISLEDYTGMWRVVCFYPADFTFV